MPCVAQLLGDTADSLEPNVSYEISEACGYEVEVIEQVVMQLDSFNQIWPGRGAWKWEKRHSEINAYIDKLLDIASLKILSEKSGIDKAIDMQIKLLVLFKG